MHKILQSSSSHSCPYPTQDEYPTVVFAICYAMTALSLSSSQCCSTRLAGSECRSILHLSAMRITSNPKLSASPYYAPCIVHVLELAPLLLQVLRASTFFPRASATYRTLRAKLGNCCIDREYDTLGTADSRRQSMFKNEENIQGQSLCQQETQVPFAD